MISIIVPVYNTADELKNSVKSILEQTHSDLEVILVNDGSTDNSGEICEELARLDNRVRVVHKENGGVASARNRGLDEAKGDYIGWVDSDDIVSPNMYKTLYDTALKYDADIVQCSHTRFLDKLQIEYPDELPSLKILNNIESLKRIYTTHYTNSCALWSKIYRRCLFDGMRFTEGAAYEDDEVVPQLLQKAERLVFFESPLYCYIKRENSIITSPKQKNTMALTSHLEKRMLRFKELDEELYNMCLRHFYQYLKNTLCNEFYLHTPVQEQAAGFLKKHYSTFFKISNKYDKINLTLLKCGMTDFVAKHGFEPIQKLLSKLKKTGG